MGIIIPDTKNINNLDNSIATIKTNLTDTTTSIPFKFGIDTNGNYGYIKDGADTVTPFKNGITYIDKATNVVNNTNAISQTYTTTEFYEKIYVVTHFSVGGNATQCNSGDLVFSVSDPQAAVTLIDQFGSDVWAQGWVRLYQVTNIAQNSILTVQSSLGGQQSFVTIAMLLFKV